MADVAWAGLSTRYIANSILDSMSLILRKWMNGVSDDGGSAGSFVLFLDALINISSLSISSSTSRGSYFVNKNQRSILLDSCGWMQTSVSKLLSDMAGGRAVYVC